MADETHWDADRLMLLSAAGECLVASKDGEALTITIEPSDVTSEGEALDAIFRFTPEKTVQFLTWLYAAFGPRSVH